MSRKQVTIFFILNWSLAFPQDRTKYFVVDTILGPREHFKLLSNKSYNIFTSGFDSHFDSIIPIDTLTRSHLTLPVVLKDSSWGVKMCFDNLGSYIEFLGLYNSKYDTLFLSNVEMQTNCLPDSVFSGIGWYINNDSIRNLRQIKMKEKKKVLRSCTGSPIIKTINITLNNEILTLPLEVSDDNQIMIEQFKGNTRRNEKRRAQGKDYKYYCGSVEEIHYLYKANLFLQ